MAEINRRATFHEKLDHQDVLEGGSDRAFGLTVGGVLLALAAYRLVQAPEQYGISALLAGLGGSLALLGLAASHLLAPLNRAWTRLGLVLSKIVNPVIMGFIFFFTIMPMGLALRLAGKDLLRLKWQPEAGSYWIQRQPPGPPPETMRQQF